MGVPKWEGTKMETFLRVLKWISNKMYQNRVLLGVPKWGTKVRDTKMGIPKWEHFWGDKDIFPILIE